MRLIDGDELYKAMKDAEDLARQRVLDTESTLPYPNNLNPSYTRYLAQMDERIKAKHMIADAPTVDAVPVQRCIDRIIQEIEELKENGEEHSDEVRQNGLLIAEGLRMALRIVEEIFWEDGDGNG